MGRFSIIEIDIEYEIEIDTGHSLLFEIEIEIGNLNDINIMLRPKPSREPPDPI
jgi:hypothetical protein